MKTLTVWMHNQELARLPLSKESLVLGRSPHCDGIVRVRGVAPIQFLIEWVGDGEFDPTRGYFQILDVSKLQATEGIADLGRKGVQGQRIKEGANNQFFGFRFQIYDDQLAESQLEGGLLREHLESLKVVRPSLSGGQVPAGRVLEIVSLRTDFDSVTDVKHLKSYARGSVRPFKEAPLLKISWKNYFPDVVIKDLPDAQVFNCGQPVPSAERVSVAPSDLIQIRWESQDYYFRLVPDVQLPRVRHSLFNEKIYKNILIGLLAFVAIIFLLKKVQAPIEKVISPPRIARVQELPVKPKPVEAIPPPTPEIIKSQPASQLTKVQDAPQRAKVVPIDRKAIKTKHALVETRARAHLSGGSRKSSGSGIQKKPVPEVEAGQLGLLGAAGREVGNHNSTVAADEVLEATNTTSSRDRRVGVSAPAKGFGNSPILAAAGTSVSEGNSYKSGLGAIQIQGGGGSFEIGSLGGTTGSGDSGDGIAEEGTEGGLDRNAVRDRLYKYRNEIKNCFERSLLTRPQLRGRIVYNWLVMGTGKVKGIHVVKSEIGYSNLEQCVLEVIRGIEFPRATSGNITKVTYPFVFHSK